MREARGTGLIRAREPKRMIFSIATVIFALLFSCVGMWMVSLATWGGPVLVQGQWWMLTWGSNGVVAGDYVLLSAQTPPSSPIDKWLMSGEDSWVGLVTEVSAEESSVLAECVVGDCERNADMWEVPLVMVHGVVSPVLGGGVGNE